MSKVGFKMIHGHNYATWELKILKFSNFGQNHISDFDTPFSVGLPYLGHLWIDPISTKMMFARKQHSTPAAFPSFFLDFYFGEEVAHIIPGYV